MFTGIIQAIGSIAAIREDEGSYVLSISTPDNFLVNVKKGDSICVNGVCLTATDLKDNQFDADVSGETIRCTSFKQLIKGSNVTGHADGIGIVKKVKKESSSTCLTVTAPKEIARYIARKGSICMDGVSLTVNSVEGDDFTVNIIPHTIENTVIINYQAETIINLEIDLIARYVERLHTYN